jgi:hypothetical protein
MPVNAPVMVRNTEGGPTVLSDLRTKEYVEWQGANDPNGGDVQAVPEEFLNNVNFMRAVQRGILVIENPEDNPEIAEAIAKQNAAWSARRERAQQTAQESIVEEANNDIVTTQCVGPGSRPDGKCPNTVSVKEKVKADKPPLCAQHESLAPQYVRSDNVSGDTTSHVWTRVTMTEREKQ